MGAGTGWFHANYWHANYWHANYWAPTGAIEGDYWHNNYWHENYWHANYWAKTGDIGDVLVTDVWDLTLTSFVTRVASGPEVLASTGTRTLTAFNPDANLDIGPPVTVGTLTLTAYNPLIGTSGYVLGDINVTFSPESTITITYGMAPGTPANGLQAFHPTTQTPNGIDVGVGTPGALSLASYNVIAQNEVEVEPLPQSLTITAYDSPAAGIGELIRVEGQPLVFGTPTHTVSGIPVANIKASLAGVELDVHTAVIYGSPPLSLPDPTWPPDDSIVNDNAVLWPSNYEMCDRTGFKLRRGQLVKEWTGVMVRKESWEQRNIQDFVRGVGDEQEGSPRPEQADRFINEEYPQGVTAEDL